MAKIENRRVSAEIDGDFVVFLIGMRVNRPWKPHRWLPVFFAMPRMLAELKRHPEMGLLHVEQRIANPFAPLIVQYWRSFEQLEAFARSKDATHFPAWVKFNKSVGSSGDVGIWHETYLVRAGDYESVYNGMPLCGLAKAGRAVPASGGKQTAAMRLGHDDAGEYPTEAGGPQE